MADETETEDQTAATPPRRRTPRTTKAPASKAEAAKAEDAPKRTRTGASAGKADSESKPAAKRTPAKPRAAKRQTPAPKRRKSEASTVEKATEKVGGRWGAAAIAGGVAAVGAVAALLTLRGSSRPEPGSSGAPKSTHAHTPDGTDASKSFAAGIADENTIPDA